ncbi:MAG: hypothetical protein L6R39_005372 [Caloplaca ligustica]|nr:MAG: hypothetical protein L6R39_005372 [Caloplaca ligustica]
MDSSTVSNSNPFNPGPYTAETYTRRADHTPRTAQPETETYILTLNTDEAHHKAVTALRDKYFPPALNKLSAHVALFRALPGSELPGIETAIQDVVRQSHPFPISTGKPFLLAHGVGLEVHASLAQDIFRTLKEQWNDFLSQQDQSFRAHYTVQNKVEDKEIARKTLEEIQGSFAGSTGTVTGLSLYLYVRGYWNLKQFYPFAEGREKGLEAPVAATNNSDWPALPGSRPDS